MDIKEYLENVVGSGSLTQDEHVTFNIKPYELVKTLEDIRYDNVVGFISFKGARLQEFNCMISDLKTVNGFVDCLNHGYVQAIRDVVNNGKISSTMKPFKFV